MICWFEIPVSDFEKSIEFYEYVLQTKLEVATFSETRHAIFSKSVLGENGGALVETPDYEGQQNIVLFFKVLSGMDRYVSRVEEAGGTVLQSKTLIKNVDEHGRTFIPETFVDQQFGYYAYFLDLDGNKVGFYSNS